ncbi:MAG: ABC transporter permease [Dyadobacter sp.]|uniref:ABC transporter permease/M1 family aminopeptidase n=1 Tax=Dyadobacter sp. TaxID=1914288 RepID=UPI001B11AD64|nr:M1 family aminopeptidase [Dyadobacter sp.]MBO9613134.1 ABC transporter permease [Dyadobacter sp.]
MSYHFRQASFRVAALLFLILGLLMSFGNFGGDEIHRNAPHVINFIICLLSLFTVFVSTLAGAAVVLRDAQHGMEPLIFTTSIGRRPYFVVRLLGLLTAVFLIMCLAAFGAAMVTFIAPPGRLGPFHISYYLAPLLLFGLPGVFFCCSIIFAAALLTRNTRWVYTAGVLVFIIYFTASILGNSPVMAGSVPAPGGPGWFSVLIDPFGFTTFFGETMNWPAWRRNQELFPLTPMFVANRLLWATISLSLLGIAYNRFKFRILSEKHHAPGRARIVQTTSPIAYRVINTRTSQPNYHRQVFWRVFGLETKTLFGPVITTLIFALWVFFNAIELFENLSNGPYGVRSYATSGLLTEQLVAVRPALLLILFYASELIHREKTTGIQQLIFSTPVSVTVFAMAKSLALVVWIFALITVHIAIGIAVQWFSGFKNFEWGTYCSLYYYAGLPLVLYTMLVIFIQTVVNHKYLGMLISGLVIGIFIFGRQLGLESYLARFATAPRLRYSDFDGFGHSGLSFNWYMLYWALIALALATIGTRIWPGHMQASWRARISMIIAGRTSAFALLCILFAIGTGFFIQFKTGHSALNRTGATDAKWRVLYERKYKPLENLPQPVITDLNLQTDLFPASHYYTLTGSMRIKNKSEHPITKLRIGIDPDIELVELVPEHSSLVSSDETFGQYGYRTDRPLAAGQEMTIRFAIRSDRSAFKTFNSEHSVVANGSYIELEKYLPHFGYRAAYEIEGAEERRQNGLPVRREAYSDDRAYHFIHFQNRISTEAGQQAVTVGTLTKSWNRAGRSYFQYQSQEPIPYMFALSSARYAVKTERYKGTTFRVYHHPEHPQNVAAMMLAMKDAVDYGNAHFASYTRHELNLAEIPHYPGSATAYPGLIFSQERNNFRSNLSDSAGFNFTYATTAHETAHQWWAGRVAAPSGPGYALLTESLAKYTEAVVTEKRFGKMYLRPYLLKDSQLYFAYRSAAGEQEMPLWKTTGQPFVHYQKGGLALFHLKETLGEAHLNRALREVVTRHGYPLKKPAPADLIQALKRGANATQVRLIDELFKKVIVFDNDIKILSNKPLPNNQQLLTLEINIRKTDEPSGKPTTMQPDDDIEIAVFGGVIATDSVSLKPVYLQRHHFSKSRSVIRIMIPRGPATVILDPLSYVLDVSDHNNVAVLN